MRFLVITFTVLFTSACAYNTPVDVSPAYNVYSNYEDKLPGRYALYVDAKETKGEGDVKGLGCAAHSYPYDGEAAFAASVTATFRNIVEDVEVVTVPMDASALIAGGYLAQLTVEVVSMEVDLRVNPGFFSATIEADTEIAATVRAVNKAGNLLGSTIEGTADAEADAGGFCEGATTAMQESIGEAIEETMERLGERLANARRLREAAVEAGLGQS